MQLKLDYRALGSHALLPFGNLTLLDGMWQNTASINKAQMHAPLYAFNIETEKLYACDKTINTCNKFDQHYFQLTPTGFHNTERFITHVFNFFFNRTFSMYPPYAEPQRVCDDSV